MNSAPHEISGVVTQRQPFALSLHANSGWFLIGSLVYALTQWGMLVVLTKLGTPAMTGVYALGLAVTAPILIFFSLNLRTAQATDARSEYLFGDYLGLRLITTGLAMALVVAIAFGIYDSESGLIILLVGIAKGFEAISDVFYGLLQRYERMDRIAISMMLKGLLSLLVFAGCVWASGHLAVGVGGLILVWAMILFAYDMRSGRLILAGSLEARIVPLWNLPVLRRLFWLTLPLGLSAMLVSLVANIPRYFVERYEGTEGLGLFAAMAYIMQAGSIITNALAQAVTPRLAKLYAEANTRAFVRLLGVLLLVGAGLGIGGIVVAIVGGREILTWLYRAEYSTQTDAFVWVMVATGLSFLASFLSYSLSATRYFRVQPFIIGVEVLVTAAACFAFVPRFGAVGAAWAMCIAMAFQMVAMAIANSQVLRSR